MHRKKPDVDVINDVLKATLVAYPNSTFIQSLSFQYQERGGLSKKQLEGLFKKAEKVKTIPGNWLATLEDEIRKKPTRYKSKVVFDRQEHIRFYGGILRRVLSYRSYNVILKFVVLFDLHRLTKGILSPIIFF